MLEQSLLIVEDDLHLGFLLMEYLESEGYTVKLCRDGDSGFQQFKRASYDCCILDVMLPEMDGFQLARRIRQENAQVPFLFLTARTMKEDKLRAFTLGAEDYITKPFDEEELLWRLRVILRRQATPEAVATLPTQFTIGDYAFNYCRQELSYQGVARRITEKENEVLRLLCLHQNQILKRDEAVEKIYGRQDYFLGRSFDVFISRIRKLLKDDPRISIENVFKVGFILNVRKD
ncbi:MAG: response regulator transcription factor [Bacteroidota bacterium]